MFSIVYVSQAPLVLVFICCWRTVQQVCKRPRVVVSTRQQCHKPGHALPSSCHTTILTFPQIIDQSHTIWCSPLKSFIVSPGARLKITKITTAANRLLSAFVFWNAPVFWQFFCCVVRIFAAHFRRNQFSEIVSRCAYIVFLDNLAILESCAKHLQSTF